MDWRALFAFERVHVYRAADKLFDQRAQRAEEALRDAHDKLDQRVRERTSKSWRKPTT